MIVNVVDDSMGSFKSSSAIKMIHESGDDESFCVITPYLDEIKIFKDPLNPEHNRGFLNLTKTKTLSDPENFGWGKLESLKNLMVYGRDIATTHALFKFADTDIIELIKANNYTLILDEVMDIIQPLSVKRNDVNLMLDQGIIKIQDDGMVIRLKEDGEFYSRYSDILNTIDSGRVVSSGDNLLLWCFPIEVLEAFKDVYILTYLFDGSLMKAYLDIFDVEYHYMSVDRDTYQFKEYIKPNISKYKDKIHILESDKLNTIGNHKSALSVSWHKTNRNKVLMDKLKNNINNYFRNVTKCKSDDFLWTSFKDYAGLLKNNGYRTDRTFCPHNARATNKYADKKVLVYAVNRFVNPTLVKYFKTKDVVVDQDKYATSEMVQWIFRSAVRKGEDINIYIPSRRMRNLLITWLNNKEV